MNIILVVTIMNITYTTNDDDSNNANTISYCKHVNNNTTHIDNIVNVDNII